jgi:hypothetical protein
MDMKTKSKLFFSRRNTNVTNRYELDQRRGSRNEIVNSNGRTNSQRLYSKQNKFFKKQLHKEETLTEITLQTGPPSKSSSQRGNSNRDYTANRTSPSKQLHRKL